MNDFVARSKETFLSSSSRSLIHSKSSDFRWLSKAFRRRRRRAPRKIRPMSKDFIIWFERASTPNNGAPIKRWNFSQLWRKSNKRTLFVSLFSGNFPSFRNKVFKDYFYSTVAEWESAINWLKQQMQTSGYWSPANHLSNEDNDTRLFQRTRSAQFTLEDAQYLLQQSSTSINGLVFHDTTSHSPMDVNDNQSQSSSRSTLVMDDSSTNVWSRTLSASSSAFMDEY